MRNAETIQPLKAAAAGLQNIIKSLFNIGRSADAKLPMTTLNYTQGFMKRLKNTLVKDGGGIFRFVMIMFVFSALFKKPVDAIIHKVFGKPYNRAEEERKKQLEEQGKQVIPELGITQNELMEKIQKNPDALKNLQNDPELTKKLQQNPKLLLDVLDGKDIANSQTSKNKEGLSDANIKYVQRQTSKAQNMRNATAPSNLNYSQNISTSANLFSKPQEKETQQEAGYDSATYVPSSEFSAKSNVSADLKKEIDIAFRDSDKLLKKAEKLI